MRLHGLYALTPDSSDDPHLLEQVKAAVRGGCRLIQYRSKNTAAATRRRQAALLADYCRARQVYFIINDDVELAQQLGADGVHLGQQDMPIGEARQRLGSAAIIGISCHASPAAAEAAAAAGADYIALGALFASATKPDAARCPLPRLREVKQRLSIPLVAIGGITPDNAAAVIAAGADMLAVSHGLFGSDDITAAATRFSRLFANHG